VLELYFESPDRHVSARGNGRFVLYRDGDGYPLPNVVLATHEGKPTVPLRDVAITDIALVGGADMRAANNAAQLLEEIGSGWKAHDPTGVEHVAFDHNVAVGRAVSRGAVDSARTANGVIDEQAVIGTVVTWGYLYTGDKGLPASGAALARLEFAPAGSKPPPHQTILDPVAERLRVPYPVRNVGIRPSYRHFAAVDFGTSTSTVTLYDTRTRVAHRTDPGQAAVLGAAISRLLKSAAPDPLKRRWEESVARLVTKVGAGFEPVKGADLNALCRRLEGKQSRGGDADRLLEVVCACLERLAAEEQDEADTRLAQWLGPKVLGCYDEAFNRPPLATLNLRPVELDRVGHAYELATELVYTKTRPVTITLGTDSADGSEVVRNLKSKLGNAEPLPAGTEREQGVDATTDDLIAFVYDHLISRTEQFAQGDDPDAPDEALTELVVTFPTITPAGTRQHLTSMLEHTLDLKKVTVEYDEGVAAALYFLMRDFSGTHAEFGAEALRARSRQVPSHPRQWQQNMLVIDIGAGTTDIALLRLTLIDVTKPIDGVDPSVQGKYYIVQPEVVNSTGHPQLGGNYLTLRVFYWLKATILDAMLTGQGEDHNRAKLRSMVRLELGLGPNEDIPILADLVAQAADVEYPVPPEIAPALSGLLPTHWEANAPETAKKAFWGLWGIAESAKIELGRDPAGDDRGRLINRGQIDPVLNAIDPNASVDVRSLGIKSLFPEAGIRLPRADFQSLARPVLAHAAELAWWLVQQSLGHDDGKPDRLDRVMLSGKTSTMELTRHVIAQELGGSGDGAEVPWNPTAISVERTYAKLAASIGAAWAESIGQRIADQPDERDELEQGRSVLKINVDNVFSSLPCEFRRLRPGERSTLLFAAGTPLVEVDSAGTLAVRREWTEQEPWPALVPTFEVHRPVQPGRTQVWGTYRFEHNAKDERGFTLNRQLWFPTAMGDGGSRIRVQVQIDQRLNPTLNICQGRPHYLITQDGPEAVRELRAEFPGVPWDEVKQRLRAQSAVLVIVGDRDELHPNGEAVLELQLPDSGSLRSDHFPDYFHEHAGLDSEPAAGQIAFRLPPPPMPDGVYRLLIRTPGGGETELEPIRVPRSGKRTDRYTATLDISGRFALHRGSPPYWPAGMLRDVEKHPGAVLFRTMEPGKPNRNPKWDPFTGKH
jgi:hypothetical protein